MPQVYVKELRAATDRDELLRMFTLAREVGFSVERLQVAGLHLRISTSRAGSSGRAATGLNDPALALAYLEMKQVHIC